MARVAFMLDPHAGILSSFTEVTPGVGALKSALAAMARVDALVPGVSLVPVGADVPVEGLLADLLFVDTQGTLTVLTGQFLSRGDDRYDHLLTADLVQAASEVVSWDAAALAARLPMAAGAQAGRLRFIVPLARPSAALDKISRLLGAAVQLHIVHWQAFADEVGRVFLFQDAPGAAPLQLGNPHTQSAAPVAPSLPLPAAAPLPQQALRATPAAPAAAPASQAPVGAGSAPVHPPAAPARFDQASRLREAAEQAELSKRQAAAAMQLPQVHATDDSEPSDLDPNVNSMREAGFLAQAREEDPRLETGFRRLLAWARGNGRVVFTQAPLLLYRPWSDLPITALRAQPNGQVELRLGNLLSQVSSQAQADVARRLRLIAGREVAPQEDVVLDPQQMLDEDIFSVLLSILRLLAYSRSVVGMRKRIDS